MRLRRTGSGRGSATCRSAGPRARPAGQQAGTKPGQAPALPVAPPVAPTATPRPLSPPAVSGKAGAQAPLVTAQDDIPVAVSTGVRVPAGPVADDDLKRAWRAAWTQLSDKDRGLLDGARPGWEGRYLCVWLPSDREQLAEFLNGRDICRSPGRRLARRWAGAWRCRFGRPPRGRDCLTSLASSAWLRRALQEHRCRAMPTQSRRPVRFSGPKKWTRKVTVREKHGQVGARTVEASAGGGAVVATATGRKDLLAMKIDPQLARRPKMPRCLEDMIVAAVNQATEAGRRAHE